MVKSVLRDHDSKIEDAMVSLHALSFGDFSERARSQGLGLTTDWNSAAVPGDSGATSKLLVNTLISLVSIFI